MSQSLLPFVLSTLFLSTCFGFSIIRAQQNGEILSAYIMAADVRDLTSARVSITGDSIWVAWTESSSDTAFARVFKVGASPLSSPENFQQAAALGIPFVTLPHGWRRVQSAVTFSSLDQIWVAYALNVPNTRLGVGTIVGFLSKGRFTALDTVGDLVRPALAGDGAYASLSLDDPDETSNALHFGRISTAGWELDTTLTAFVGYGLYGFHSIAATTSAFGRPWFLTRSEVELVGNYASNLYLITWQAGGWRMVNLARGNGTISHPEGRRTVGGNSLGSDGKGNVLVSHYDSEVDPETYEASFQAYVSRASTGESLSDTIEIRTWRTDFIASAISSQQNPVAFVWPRGSVLYFKTLIDTTWYTTTSWDAAALGVEIILPWAMDVAVDSSGVLWIVMGTKTGQRRDLYLVKARGSNEVDTLITSVPSEERPPENTEAAVSLWSYPNPLRNHVTLMYRLPFATRVTLRIYDLRGRLVRSLDVPAGGAGTRRVRWDGRDSAGRPVASGIYMVQLQAGPFSVQRKLVVLK